MRSVITGISVCNYGLVILNEQRVVYHLIDTRCPKGFKYRWLIPINKCSNRWPWTCEFDLLFLQPSWFWIRKTAYGSRHLLSLYSVFFWSNGTIFRFFHPDTMEHYWIWPISFSNCFFFVFFYINVHLCINIFKLEKYSSEHEISNTAPLLSGLQPRYLYRLKRNAVIFH